MTKLPEVSWKQVFEKPKQPEHPTMMERAAIAFADSLDDGENWSDYQEQVITVLEAIPGPDQSVDVAELLRTTGAKRAILQAGMSMTVGLEPKR